MLVYELWVNSHLSRAQFGWNFFWTSSLGPGLRSFRRPALHLWHAGHFGRVAGPSPFRSAWPRPSFFPSWLPRNLSDTISFLIDLLAAVPSVIYGLLGIFVVVPLMRTTIGPR